MTNSDVTLAPMQQSDIATLETWFQDTELNESYEGMLPLQRYFDYVQGEANYFAWMALEHNTPVGAAFMQIEPETPQSCAFFVNPKLRAQGYGKRILQMLMTQPEAAAARQWQIGVRPQETVCRRCLTSVGFAPDQDKPDEDGFLQYVLVRDQ